MKKIIPEYGLIDVHTHCSGLDLSNFLRYKYPTGQDINDLDHKRRGANVAFQVVFPMPTSIYYDIPHYWRKNQFCPSGYCDFPFQLENERLLQEISAFKLHKMLPFLAFSLQDCIEDQVNEIRRLAGLFPVYGLKFHTKTDQNTPRQLSECGEAFLCLAEELNIPILIHTELKYDYNGERVLELAEKTPNVRFCAAHFGGFSDHFLNRLSDYPGKNLFFDMAPARILCSKFCLQRGADDVANLPYENPEEVIINLAERFGSRILWGTDSPWYNVRNLETPDDTPFFTYEEEARIPFDLGLVGQLYENTVYFLFGEKD